MPVLHTYSFSSIYSNIISPSTVFYLQCLFDSSNFSNQLRRFFQDLWKKGKEYQIFLMWKLLN